MIGGYKDSEGPIQGHGECSIVSIDLSCKPVIMEMPYIDISMEWDKDREKNSEGNKLSEKYLAQQSRLYKLYGDQRSNSTSLRVVERMNWIDLRRVFDSEWLKWALRCSHTTTMVTICIMIVVEKVMSSKQVLISQHPDLFIIK